MKLQSDLMRLTDGATLRDGAASPAMFLSFPTLTCFAYMRPHTPHPFIAGSSVVPSIGDSATRHARPYNGW